MSIYLRKNALPIFIEIIFVVSCFFVPQEYYIYSNLLFYLLLFADFYVKREFSFRKWVKNLKGGKTFWKQVIVTTNLFRSENTKMCFAACGQHIRCLWGRVFAKAVLYFSSEVHKNGSNKDWKIYCRPAKR